MDEFIPSKIKTALPLFAGAVALSLVSCTHEELHRGGIGAAGGAVVGGILGGGDGAAAGAIVGGLAGAGTARYRYTDYAYPGGYARPSYGYGYYPPTPPPAYYGYYPY